MRSAVSSATRPKRDPEFTTVELYQAYTDFHGMMDIAEGDASGCSRSGRLLSCSGRARRPDPRLAPSPMVEAVREYAGVDFDAITDDAEAVAAAKAIGMEGLGRNCR